MKTYKIPEATIIRLSVYSRYLTKLEQRGVTTISSELIAAGIGGTPAQVRKDLAYFGEFGVRGVGYNVEILNKHIIKILGLTETWNAIIVGAGNLGLALSQYKGFQERNFDILALFDNDFNKVGQYIGKIPILSLEVIRDFIHTNNVQIGIVAVPATFAQDTVNILIEAKVKSILNFAPEVVSVPKNVILRNVDLAVNLEILTFSLNNR